MNTVPLKINANIKRLHWSIQTYLLVTELLFIFGPWQWDIKNKFQLISFLFGVHFVIFLGYYTFKSKYLQLQNFLSNMKDQNDYIFYIKIIIIINILFCIPTSLSRTDSFIPDIFAGLADLGRAYNSNYENNLYGNPYAFVEYFRIIFSPLIIGINAIIAFYWLKMTRLLKYLSAIIILFNLAIYVAIGTNKGIADVALIIPFFIHLRNLSFSDQYNILVNRTNIFGLMFFALFLIFFGVTQSLRAGNVGIDGVFNTGTYLIYADPDATPAWLGRDVLIIYQSLTRYLTSGYQALVYSFEVDNLPTFGISNSMFAIENIDKLFSTDYFYRNSYPTIIETQFGWSNYYLWHTAYVWFASDFGYIGTYVLVGFFSYTLFKSIMIISTRQSIIHIILCQQLIILFLYLPANNQVFQNGEGFIGTIIIFIAAFIWERRNFVN